MRTKSTLALLVTLASAGCGSSRTVAATQPNPAAFDATKSDAKAIEVADRVLTAVGGAEAWQKAHEIVWDEAVTVDGKVLLAAHHAWDRWDGRHHYSFTDGAGNQITAMYEIYGDVGTALSGNITASAGARKEIIDMARARWAADTYLMFMPFKLKDPGVHLTYVEEVVLNLPGDEAAEPAGAPAPVDGEAEQVPPPAQAPTHDVLKVTFDPGVGVNQDTYFVVIDKATNLIEVVELVRQGDPETKKVAYRWSDWQDVGGLKFSAKRQNVGYDGEVITFTGIEIHASSDEDLYVPVVR